MAVTDAPSASEATFAHWTQRLVSVSQRLQGLHREYAACQTAVIEAKAAAYEASSAKTHGERQGIASASVAMLETEKLRVKGELDALTEERDLLTFLIEWVGE